MSKFSQTKTKTISKRKTINKAGGEAFKESTKLELVSTLLTSFITDKFYESSNDTITRIQNLCTTVKDKLFVAKSAIYARTKFGMRSVSHVVAGEIANIVKGETWTKNFFDKVVYRPDDMSEILAYYMNSYGKPIPNSLKKGLAIAFDKFDTYSLAKYRGEGHEISLVDVVNLVHPRPSEKNEKALRDLVNGELRSKDTWEKELSAVGQKTDNEEEKEELKAEVWAKLIKEKKIGYFALLRNLRNIIEQAPEMIDEACNLLIEKKAIEKSLVLPFRFQTAIKELSIIGTKDSRKVISALNKALDISLSNVPKFEGDTLVILDVSGSMQGKPLDIGSLFGAIIAKSNSADIICFATNAKMINVNLDDTTNSIAEKIASMTNTLGGGTDFHSFWHLIKKNYDRIVILSDMQGWAGFNVPSSEFKQYKKFYNNNVKLFSFNLNDYGTLQFPEENVYCLAGWSEKTLDAMKLLEKDKTALIKEIEKIEL